MSTRETLLVLALGWLYFWGLLITFCFQMLTVAYFKQTREMTGLHLAYIVFLCVFWPISLPKAGVPALGDMLSTLVTHIKQRRKR